MRAELVGNRVPAAGSRKLSVPTATHVAPGRDEVGRVTAVCDATHPDHRDADTRAHVVGLLERDRSDRRARQAPARRCRATAGRARVEREPFHGVDEREASAPPASAASRDRGGPAFGVSFTINGLRVRGRTAPRTPPGLSRVGAHHAAGLHVRARDVQLEHGDLRPRLHALDERGELVGREARHATRSAAPGAVRARAGPRSRNPLTPLFGSPIELIIPAGVSQRRGGGLPPRARRDGLGDEGREGKRGARGASPKVRRAATASKVPGPLRIGWASRETGEVDRPCRRAQSSVRENRYDAIQDSSRVGRRDDRPVDTEARCSRLLVLTTQPKHAPNPHAIASSIAS